MREQKIEYIKGIDSIIGIKPHGNKRTCNKNMLEINPTVGCQFQCQYCNAYTQDGNSFSKVKVYIDYPLYFEQYLKNHKEELDKKFFYFSPKIDAFQNCLFETGITQKILELLLEYNARYIIVTKGGIPHSEICDLLVQSKHLNQFLISCSMPNEETRMLLEPFAAPIEERLKFAEFLVDNDIKTTAIFSPILPINHGDYIKQYIKYYLSINITHFRLNYAEVSRSCLQSLTNLLPEYAEEFLEIYLNDEAVRTEWQVPYMDVNINRYFPSAEYMRTTFENLRLYAKTIDPLATFSICNSLCDKEELCDFNNEAFQAGFGCIGYKW